MAGHRFYEEGEAEEILRRALHQSDSIAIDRDRLLSMAAELGISEDAIARAEAQMAAEREAEANKSRLDTERAEFRKKRRAGFWSDLSSYIGVNGFLVGIWWFTGQGYFWPGWVLAAWGIGLFSDFFSAFFGNTDKEFERWQRRKARRAKATRQISDLAPRTDEFLDSIYPENPDAKLEMIKSVREEFGLDLADAKRVVEDYVRRRPNPPPGI